MTVPVAVLAMGPAAVLAEFAALDEVLDAAAALDDDRPDGIVDVVPAMRTVLVTWATPAAVDVDALLEWWRRPRATIERVGTPTVEIPVRYDGPDLDDVARATGLTTGEVIDVHAGADYRAAFCGFRPGFAYLVGLDERLHLARRADPRPRVDAGSVAVAAEFTAVYPSTSPGGWHLIGRTERPIWDPGRPEDALVRPGTSVRFLPS